MDEKEYPVSEAVRLIGVESHVLRYWEEELQIEIHRSSQGHRLYSAENIDMFRRVKELKEKGLQLKAIRLLMDENGKSGAGPEAADDGFVRQIRELAGANLSGEQGEDQSTARKDGGQEIWNEAENGDRQEGGSREPEEVCCEIIPLQEQGDDMYRFRQILRRLIEEVVSEQNEKLEEALAERMKEEMEDFYLQCCQIVQETAVSLGPEGKRCGRVRRALRRLLGLER